MADEKLAKKIAIFCGKFCEKKIYRGAQKVAQMTKIASSGHTDVGGHKTNSQSNRSGIERRDSIDLGFDIHCCTGANVLNFSTSVLRIFSPYFHILFYGDLRIHFTKIRRNYMYTEIRSFITLTTWVNIHSAWLTTIRAHRTTLLP